MSDSGLSGRVEIHHSPQNDKRATLYSAAARLGDEYLEQLATANLTVEQSEVAVLGYYNDLNVIEQLKGGEDPENFKLLIMASKRSGFDVNEFFDESGSYIDYAKIKEFLRK